MFHMINKRTSLKFDARLASIFIYFKILLEVLVAPNGFCSA